LRKLNLSLNRFDDNFNLGKRDCWLFFNFNFKGDRYGFEIKCDTRSHQAV